MNPRHDRDHVYIKGRGVLHSTARRDWVCGCGSQLTTRFFEDAPHWRTVCIDDAGHDPDSFVHKSAWAYAEGRALLEAAEARQVFAHLPADFQAAIVANQKGE